MIQREFGLAAKECVEVLNIQTEDIPKESHSHFNPENIVGVEFVNNGFYYIPQQLKEFMNVSILKISYNKLEFLTGEVFGLKNLRCLVIEHCQLTHLPPSMSMLSNLRIIFAPHNKIEYVAPEVFSIPALKYINLDFNNIKRLDLSMLQSSMKIVVSLVGNPLELEDDDELLGANGLKLILQNYIFLSSNRWAGIPLYSIYKNVLVMREALTKTPKSSSIPAKVILAVTISCVILLITIKIFVSMLSKDNPGSSDDGKDEFKSKFSASRGGSYRYQAGNH